MSISKRLLQARNVVAIICTCFFLYTGIFGNFTALMQRAWLLMFTMVIIFLGKPMIKNKPDHWTRYIDILLAILSIITTAYPIYAWKSIIYRSGEALPWEWIPCVILCLLLFEACRRSIGIAMPIIAVISLLYAIYGRSMPLIIAHRGFTLQQMLSYTYLTMEGIWGTCLGVTSTIIVYFMIFAGFLACTGANNGFLALSQAAFGRMRGGPAKMAVVASGLFGTISGSAPANVAGTGTITIPLMKKTGYSPEFAGAVEAVASSGGQLMPPIMGSAAFIMAESLGVTYGTICRCALLPAILYYISAFIMVEMEARKNGLRGLSKAEVPSMKESLKKWWPVLAPLIALIYMLVSGMTPSRAAMYGLATLVIISFFRPETRLNKQRVFSGFTLPSIDLAPIGVVSGVAGIIIGVLGRTGLGAKLASVIVQISGGSMLIVLLLTMVCSIIMGMGLPTVACYILLSASIANAIYLAGGNLISAHFFVFYFGIISAITPPVAMASYTASGIAGGDFNKLGWTAVKIAMPAFLLPFFFVYSPELLLISGDHSLILVAVGAVFGVFCMSVGLHGYLRKRLNWIQRIMLICGSLMLIAPGTMTDLIGLAVCGLALAWHYIMAARDTVMSPAKNSTVISAEETSADHDTSQK